MQTRSDLHPPTTSAPLPIDTDQKSPLQGSAVAPGTFSPVFNATRHSPANASMPSRPSPTTAYTPATTPNTNPSGMADTTTTATTTSNTTGAIRTPTTTPTQPRKQRRPSHIDVVAQERSPTNPLSTTVGGCVTAEPRPRRTPTLPTERLGEPPAHIAGQPPLLDGASLNAVPMGGGSAVSFTSPMPGVLDTPATSPSAFATSTGSGSMPVEHTVAVVTPATPAEHSSTNLILYNVGPNMSEGELKRLFEPYGPVASCAVMRDIHTGVGLGTAFVKFVVHADAARALEAFGDRSNPVYVFEGRPLVVQWARKQHDGTPSGEARKKIMKLFVRNIPLNCTADDLEALFSQHGTVRQVTLHRDTAPVQDEALVRLIAFVIYAEEGCAERAAGALHNTKPFSSCNGIPIMIKLAESSQRRRFTRNGDTGPTPVAVQPSLPPSFGVQHTSPMKPGLGMANFDMTAIGAPHLQRPGYAGLQPMPPSDQSFDQPSGSCYSSTMLSLEGNGGVVPHAASTLTPLLADGRDTSNPSFQGTPASITPLALHGSGNWPTLPRGSAGGASHAWDRDSHVSPMPSFAATIPGVGVVTAAGASCGPLSASASTSAATHQGALSFDANAVGQAYGGGSACAVSASSRSNGASGHDSVPVWLAGGTFLYTNVPSPQSSGGGGRGGGGVGWHGNQSGAGQNTSFSSSSPPLPRRGGGDESRSPPTAMHVYTGAPLAPLPGQRLPATASSAQGSPQQPSSLAHSPGTSVPTSPAAVSQTMASHVMPPALNGQVSALAKVLMPSEEGAADLSNTILTNGISIISNAPPHHIESPTTQRVDASESWRRAVRTHVHHTKRLLDPGSVTSSQFSSSSMSASGHHAPPQPVTSPLVAIAGAEANLSLSTGNDPAIPAESPPISPTSNSAMSAPDLMATRAGGSNAAAPTSGQRTRSTESPSSGHTRYYNNPYSTENARLFF